MKELAFLGVKALAGGSLVVLFALAGEVSRPKLFAGIFSAAPSVALAGLVVTMVDKGADGVAMQATGMIAGAASLAIACLIGARAVRRLRALKGAVVTVCGWLAVTGVLYGLLLR